MSFILSSYIYLTSSTLSRVAYNVHVKFLYLTSSTLSRVADNVRVKFLYLTSSTLSSVADNVHVRFLYLTSSTLSRVADNVRVKFLYSTSSTLSRVADNVHVKFLYDENIPICYGNIFSASPELGHIIFQLKTTPLSKVLLHHVYNNYEMLCFTYITRSGVELIMTITLSIIIFSETMF